MKRVSYLILFIGIVIGAIVSARLGALTIAASFLIFNYPDFNRRRAAEKVIVLALVVSLVTVALALPRH